MSWRTRVLFWCVGAATALSTTPAANAQCEPVEGQSIADGEGEMDPLKFVLINQTFPPGTQADGVQNAIPAALTNAITQWNNCNEGPPLSEGTGGWKIYTINLSKQDPETGEWVCGEKKGSTKEILIYANSPGCTGSMMMNAILHETGHVLGLGHTTCPGKVMYREGQQGVTTKDSEACQVLNKIYVTPEEEEEQPGSPLVFDLDGDGIGTTAVDVSPVYFDLDADGAVDELGWIAPRTPDAFLWLDLNANGAVDNGAELFGNFTQLPDGQRAENGFEALAQYDLPELGGNGDGRINSDDNIWLRLALWSDWNHDGLTLRSEITPLSESGVIAISLRYTPRGWIDEQGNLHRGIGRFWARNASGRGRVTGHVEDLWFRMR